MREELDDDGLGVVEDEDEETDLDELEVERVAEGGIRRGGIEDVDEEEDVVDEGDDVDDDDDDDPADEEECDRLKDTTGETDSGRRFRTEVNEDDDDNEDDEGLDIELEVEMVE